MPRLSQRVQGVQPPVIPQVAEWIRQHPGTLSLGQGVAGYAPPDEAWKELQRLEREPLLHRYQSVDGLPELQEALAQHLHASHQLDLDPSRALMVTAGANAAFLQVILAICDPGDEVLLPLPFYFNQDMALALANVRAIPVPCDARHHPDLERLRRAITPRTRAIVTVSPNNPTGAVYPESTLRAVQDLCRHHGLYHISDETYAAFVYDDAHHCSPGAFPDASPHTISLFSLSKAYGFASWRIGFAVYPVGLRDALRKIQDTHLICPPVVSQLAALGCLRAGPDWLRQRHTQIAAVRQRVLEALAHLPDSVQCSPLDGAFYAFLTLPRRFDPVDLAHRLVVEHRVAVLPGTAFGDTQACHLRVAYGALTPESAADGVGRLVTGLHALLP